MREQLSNLSCRYGCDQASSESESSNGTNLNSGSVVTTHSLPSITPHPLSMLETSRGNRRAPLAPRCPVLRLLLLLHCRRLRRLATMRGSSGCSSRSVVHLLLPCIRFPESGILQGVFRIKFRNISVKDDNVMPVVDSFQVCVACKFT